MLFRSADFGGLEGADKHCQTLAAAAGAGGRTWRAYLSATPAGGNPAVHARDRIGAGPWYNFNGVMVAGSLDELHGDNKLTKQTSVTEKGAVVDGSFHAPFAEELAKTDVMIIFKGDAGYMSAPEKAALEAFVKRGGGLVLLPMAVHAAGSSHEVVLIETLAIGLGVASFSHAAGVHYQNVTEIEPYLAAINAGQRPTKRAFRIRDRIVTDPIRSEIRRIPASLAAIGFNAPVHARITGRSNERDRREARHPEPLRRHRAGRFMAGGRGPRLSRLLMPVLRHV